MSGARTAAGFPKVLRLLKRREYDRVFAGPRRSSDALFTVLARANTLGVPRLGLAVARKHARRAVDRNRVKRVARETFRLRQHDLAGLDLVVLGRQGLARHGNAALRNSLERHLTRLNAECRPSC